MPNYDWWQKPRKIFVVVDNDSWILPFAEQLVKRCSADGDDATLCRTHSDVGEGGVAFYLGCLKITPPKVLERNYRNLVVHASDLPHGRGFSPWTYAVLEGKDEIPVCLIEAADEVDTGDIIYKDWIKLDGNELVTDLRNLIGEKTIELCQRFLAKDKPVFGEPQKEVSGITYKRRYPEDSKIDVTKTIEEQFNLFRVIDNEKYPAFFDYMGRRYKLLIAPDEQETEDK